MHEGLRIPIGLPYNGVVHRMSVECVGFSQVLLSVHPYICVEEGELLAIRALLDVGEDNAGADRRRELLRGLGKLRGLVLVRAQATRAVAHEGRAAVRCMPPQELDQNASAARQRWLFVPPSRALAFSSGPGRVPSHLLLRAFPPALCHSPLLPISGESKPNFR